MLPLPASLFPEFPAEDQRHHHDALMLAVQRVLQSGRFILGEEGLGFEAEYAAHLGGGHVTGVATGTDAIELLLRALDIRSNQAVVLPALAPSAVAAAVRRAGARIVLCDVEEGTLTLCPRALVEQLKGANDIRAVLAVHLYGHPCDWTALEEVCEAHGVFLIEDASQAHGAVWRQKKVGTLGKASVWSFYPTKNLGALGDAGAIWTSDPALAEKLRCLREYGWVKRQISDVPGGINSRLDEIQAAMLRVKLPELARHNERRKKLASKYTEALQNVRPPVVREGCVHAFHQFVVCSGQRDAMLEHLRRHGVPAAVHYPAALHQQAAFACEETFPMAERAVREVLSLPMHPYLSDAAIEAVIRIMEDFQA
jgi:dTDP-4-amino-4,6-dideoxygalactose transaminase